jgi:hypothetical protein
MAANTVPIFTKAPSAAQFARMTAGNTTRDLSSGTTYTVFTAGSEGSRVEKLILQPLGTNTTTVVRIFRNNGGTITVGTNNSLIREIAIQGTTASEVAALASVEIPLDLGLKATERLVCTIGTAVSAGIDASAVAGEY